MLRRPPEILITTPESLNILLTSASGLRMLRGVRVTILDEIHAVAGIKRGTHLITAVERLGYLGAEQDPEALAKPAHHRLHGGLRGLELLGDPVVGQGRGVTDQVAPQQPESVVLPTFLELAGATVTLDAMHCQQETVAQSDPHLPPQRLPGRFR